MNRKKFLALGDSYTIGEGVPPEERWPDQLTQRLRATGIAIADPEIIATTGWRTDDLQNALRQKRLTSDYDLVSMLIGVNNQYQGKPLDHYASEFEDLITMAIHAGKGNPVSVFVVSIPDYGFTPFGHEKQAEISKGVDAFNRVNRTIAAEYGIRYVDITDISRRALDEPDLLTSDNLHPSGKMYTEWVDRILTGGILQAFEM